MNLENWDRNTLYGSIARYYPKVCASRAWSFCVTIREKITWRDINPRTMRPQSSMDLAKNVCKLKNSDKATFHSVTEARAMPAPTSKSQRRDRSRTRFRSIDAHGEHKRVEFRRIVGREKAQNPNSSVD